MAQGACKPRVLSCVPKNRFSSMRHVSSCASQHTEHQHKFSLTYISCFIRLPLRIQTCCPRIHLPTAKIHLSQVMSQKRIELNRTLFNLSNQEIDDQDDIKEIGVKPMFCSESLIHSANDSAESIATPPDLDLEDEQLRKMLASQLYTEVSAKLDAESVQKREANAQRAQVYH